MGNFVKSKFESTNQVWKTPDIIIKPLDNEFNFNMDLACNEENKICQNGFTEKEDSLLQDWSKYTGWLNPPFDSKRPMKKWVEKAYKDTIEDGVVVALLPVRSNTNWWHDYVMKAKEVRFIKGRPKFINENGELTHGLPQPLSIIVFQKTDKPTKYSSFTLNGESQ